MTLKTTIGRLLVDEALPKELKSSSRVLDKKGMDSLMQEAAAMGGDVYRDVSHKLLQVGKQVSQATGGNSFGPEHISLSVAGRRAQHELSKKVDAIHNNNKLSDDEKDKQVVDLLMGAGDQLTKDVLQESLSEHNPLAMQIVSGSRGNPTNLRSLRAGDLLYVDSAGKPIPIPIFHSYSQGLTPAEFYAGTFGARSGVLSSKFSVRDTGFLSKQLVQASHRLLVTDIDHEDGDKPQESIRGLPVDIDDAGNEGALLAIDAGPYKRNTVLTPRILAELKDEGLEKLLIRSPLVGGPPDGGVYARDVGVREKGNLAPIGDYVGISSAQAASEVVTQGALGAKHGGGVAMGGKPTGPAGFELIDQLIQVPRTFKGGAAHAQEDGIVTDIHPAPQGGTYVVVNGQNVYVGRGYDPTVKVGDTVEAGDAISDGIPNPAEIVKHKGIGEGRHYFTKAFVKAYKDSNFPIHRRNAELIARALIDHIEMTDEMGGHLPGDITSYSAMEHKYEPRPGHQVVKPKSAKDKYLEQPVLHYSIGDKVKPSVIKTLDDFGVKNVMVHDDPPPFQPRMVRAMENLTHDKDWMTRFIGSYLKKTFLDSAHSGAVSDEHGTSFVPSLARAVDFGKRPPTKGWVPTGPLPKAPTPAPSILKQINDYGPSSEVGEMFSKASSSEAADDYFKDLAQSHPAGHVVHICDEDDDRCPVSSIEYHVPHHRLPGHTDESGDDLGIFVGSDRKGRAGQFVIHRPDMIGKKTKFYKDCTEEEEDKLLREFAPLLSDVPVKHKHVDDLVEAIKAHR